MAHHRKVRTSSKKENKRIDHKKVRQSEIRAMRGDKPGLVRSDKYSLRLGQAPAEGPSNGKPSKKKQPKKVCPVTGGRHHYLVDTEEYDVTYHGFLWFYDDTRTYSTTRIYKLCGWCGEERTLKVVRTRRK